MKRTCATIVLTSLVGAALAAPAQGATAAQLGQKCRAAWTGKVPSAAFTVYKAKCVQAATAAVDAATDAGNPTSKAANTARATKACGVRFPAPRSTPAKRAAFAACVAAGVASQRAFAPRALRATLTGQSEVPPAGTATGTALIRLNANRKRVCYTLRATSALGSPVNAAHIHDGVAGASGGALIGFENLSPLDNGRPATGCVRNVDLALIKRIRANPSAFYVNVHTVDFPGGAMRGQLQP